MKNADVDIEELIKAKTKQLKLLEKNLRGEYRNNFNRYEFDRIRKKVDRILDIKDDDSSYRRIRTR